MEQVEKDKYKNKVFTIPNILSFIRLLMIPLIIWLYIGKKNYIATGIVLLVSGLTDIVDGFIARHFNMISDVGKVLDPFADKATQGVMLLCLLARFPIMWMPIILLVLKESFMALSGFMVVRKCDVVLGANWHGKLATVLLTATMALHLFWYDIPEAVSIATIALSTAMIVLSLVLYAVRNLGYLMSNPNKNI